jgi:4-alpha-glucanotransferase
MNLPSTVSGNWSWRLSGTELTTDLAAELADLVEAAGRG